MWKWVWDNVSNIDAIRSIIVAIFGAIISVAVYLRRKWIKHVKRNQLKYFKLDKQTKQSMKYYVSTRGLKI